MEPTTYNWPNLEPMLAAFFLARKITKVNESIPWVCCYFGNVFMSGGSFALFQCFSETIRAPYLVFTGRAFGYMQYMSAESAACVH